MIAGIHWSMILLLPKDWADFTVDMVIQDSRRGSFTLIAKRTLIVPITLLCWVKTARDLSIIEYGADLCSPKWTTASGWKSWKLSWRNWKSQMSPTCRLMCFPEISPHLWKNNLLFRRMWVASGRSGSCATLLRKVLRLIMVEEVQYRHVKIGRKADFRGWISHQSKPCCSLLHSTRLLRVDLEQAHRISQVYQDDFLLNFSESQA